MNSYLYDDTEVVQPKAEASEAQYWEAKDFLKSAAKRLAASGKRNAEAKRHRKSHGYQKSSLLI